MKYILQKIYLRFTSRGFLILALFLTLLLSKDFLAARTLESLARTAGVPMKIEHFHLNLVKSQIWAKDIRVGSPEGFMDEPMFDIEFLFINLRVLQTLTNPGLHLGNMALQLDEIRFVRNKEGLMNANLNKIEIPLKIDQFEIVIDRIVYKDLDLPAGSLERSFDVGIREKHMEVNDVESLNGLMRVITLKAVRNASFARLLNLNPQDFVKDNVFALLGTTRLVDKAANAVKSVVGLGEKPAEAPLDAKTAEKQTAEQVKEVQAKTETVEKVTEQVETVQAGLEVKKELAAEIKTEIKELKKDDTAAVEVIEEKKAELEKVKEEITETSQLVKETKAELKQAEADAKTAQATLQDLTGKVSE